MYVFTFYYFFLLFIRVFVCVCVCVYIYMCTFVMEFVLCVLLLRAQDGHTYCCVGIKCHLSCNLSLNGCTFAAWYPCADGHWKRRSNRHVHRVLRTKGTGATVGLGDGDNFLSGARRMNERQRVPHLRAAQGNRAARTCGEIRAARSSRSRPLRRTPPQTLTVFGRIPPGQDVSVGSFGDSVQITVTHLTAGLVTSMRAVRRPPVVACAALCLVVRSCLVCIACVCAVACARSHPRHPRKGDSMSRRRGSCCVRTKRARRCC